MYNKNNKFAMPSMQFFSHLSRTAHCAIGTCDKQIVHNSRSIENVISCSVLAETTPPIIVMKVASEPIDASQTRMTKEKGVKVSITKTTNL